MLTPFISSTFSGEMLTDDLRSLRLERASCDGGIVTLQILDRALVHEKRDIHVESVGASRRCRLVLAKQ
jgi:hypothetical protein